MATAKQLAKQLLKAYTEASVVNQSHQKHKIEALLNTRPKYKLFELEHPYYEISKQTAKSLKEVRALVKMLIDSRIGEWTVREAFEDMRSKLNDKYEVNQHLNILLAL